MRNKPDEWRSFPVLQTALKGKQYPGADTRTSLDEGPFQELNRLMGIAVCTLEYKSAVRDGAQANHRVSADAVHEEIEELSERLNARAAYFAELARDIAKMHQYIEQPSAE